MYWVGLDQGYLEVLHQGIFLGLQGPIARIILVSRRPRCEPLTFGDRRR